MPRDYDEEDEYEDEDRDYEREDKKSRLVRRTKEKVKGPAIALIVLAVLSFVGAALSIVNFLTIDSQMAVEEEKVERDPNMGAQQKQFMREWLAAWKKGMKIGLPIVTVLGSITAFITLLGGIQMLKVSGRGLAITGSILSMIPGLSTCCLLGLPLGIWVLVVLMNADVKKGFAAARRINNSEDHEY